MAEYLAWQQFYEASELQKFGDASARPPVIVNTAFQPPPQQVLLSPGAGPPDKDDPRWLPYELKQRAMRDLEDCRLQGRSNETVLPRLCPS